MEPGEVITSFDVKALFTSVPVHPAMQTVKQRLQQDTTLPQRTSMSIPQITSLLEFCLTNTYFLFQGKYYEQVQGAAMGSPISPLIANIFMEKFEVQALSSIPPHAFGKGLLMIPLSSTGRTQSGSSSSHQQPGPTYPVHSGTNTTRLTPIPRHPNHHITRQHLQHHGLQDTNPHRPISALGQQPPHHSQTKCIQHPSTQGQSSILFTRQTG